MSFYEANGNLADETDAQIIMIDYDYDVLNQVPLRDYSDATPNLIYNDNPTNAQEKLIKVSSSVSTTEYTSFDILGRVTGHKQTTDGNDYSTAYTYNLSGARGSIKSCGNRKITKIAYPCFYSQKHHRP